MSEPNPININQEFLDQNTFNPNFHFKIQIINRMILTIWKPFYKLKNKLQTKEECFLLVFFHDENLQKKMKTKIIHWELLQKEYILKQI